MAAERYNASGANRPASMGAALAITGLMLTGMVLAAPDVVPFHRDAIRVWLDPLPPVPPPDPIPQPKPQPHARVAQPRPLMPPAPMPLPTQDAQVQVTSEPQPVAIDTGAVAASGSGVALAEPAKPSLPALVGATVDARYAGDFQPPYPPEEVRAGREGRVVVRVLIGVDGRVKDVAEVSATSDAFYAATRRQALAHWRFHPATRGDIPVEAWRTMTVRFVLND